MQILVLQRKESSNAQDVNPNTIVLLTLITQSLLKLIISSKTKSHRLKIISRYFAKITQKIMRTAIAATIEL